MLEETPKFEIYTDDRDDEGKEISDMRSRLIVMRNGEQKYEQYDGGEPEDNYYFRDHSWIESAIQNAYDWGLEDGRNEQNS